MVKTGWHKLVFATYWQKPAKTQMEYGFLPLTAFCRNIFKSFNHRHNTKIAPSLKAIQILTTHFIKLLQHTLQRNVNFNKRLCNNCKVAMETVRLQWNYKCFHTAFIEVERAKRKQSWIHRGQVICTIPLFMVNDDMHS